MIIISIELFIVSRSFDKKGPNVRAMGSLNPIQYWRDTLELLKRANGYQ